MTAPKLRVFLSSRIRGNSPWRDIIAQALEECAHEAIRFPESWHGQREAYAFLPAVQASDVMVYLISEYSPEVEHELQVARQEGIPLVLLANRAVGDPGSWHLTDEARRWLHSEVNVKIFVDSQELAAIVKNEVEGIISRRFAEPRGLTEWGPEAYKAAAGLISSCGSRFALCQETSSLLLGPRRGRLAQERRFLASLFDVVFERATRTGIEVRHVFDQECTASEIEGDRRSYPEAIEWLDRTMELVDGGRIRLLPSNPPITPLMISDSSVLSAVFLGGKRKYGYPTMESGRLAQALWEELTEFDFDLESVHASVARIRAAATQAS